MFLFSYKLSLKYYNIIITVIIIITATYISRKLINYSE